MFSQCCVDLNYERRMIHVSQTWASIFRWECFEGIRLCNWENRVECLDHFTWVLSILPPGRISSTYPCCESLYKRRLIKDSCCLSALPRKKNLKLGASLLLTVSTFLPPNPRLVELGYWLLIRKEFTNSYMTAFRTDFESNHLSLKTSVMGISPSKRHLFPNTVPVYVAPVPGAL